MIDTEKQRIFFKDHVATYVDYGNIKILDFKEPNSSHYRIRFLFEEDYCRLHISGDLGHLIATNYNNMTYEKFSDFTNNVGYFIEKVDCHDRDIYTYDVDKAREELIELIEELDLKEELGQVYDWETEEDSISDVISEILEDFSEDRGIGSKGYDVASKYISDFWEDAGRIGKQYTRILDLYMLAFKLAKEQVDSRVNRDLAN